MERIVVGERYLLDTRGCSKYPGHGYNGYFAGNVVPVTVACISPASLGLVFDEAIPGGHSLGDASIHPSVKVCSGHGWWIPRYFYEKYLFPMSNVMEL